MKAIRIFSISIFLVLAGLTALTFTRYLAEDHTPPVITCDSEILAINVTDDETVLCQGITAWDNPDGDLTSQVFVEHTSGLIDANTAKVTYAVFDSSDNVAKLTRYVRYTDYKKPKFQITKPLIYKMGEQITLLDRLVVSDVVDGDITSQLRLTMSYLSNSAAGRYPIMLQATNSLGDTAFLPVTVIVVGNSPRLPEITLTDYLIYVPAGTKLLPRQYLDSVRDPGAAKQPGLEKVAVDVGMLDMETPGVYEIIYSYSNGVLGCETILTVVVE